MASAFTLTMAYLAEQYSAERGRKRACRLCDRQCRVQSVRTADVGVAASSFGLEITFYVFAALNLAGAVLVFFTLKRMAPMNGMMSKSPFAAWVAHFRNPPLRAAFGIGFLVLFVFLGTFTYVNFVLAREPIGVWRRCRSASSISYFCRRCSRRRLAGRAAVSVSASRPTFWPSFAVAAAGLPLMLVPSLPFVLAGLVLVACRHVLCASGSNGLRQPHGHDRAGRGERHLSRLLLSRRARGQRGVRRRVRHVRLERDDFGARRRPLAFAASLT